MRYIDMQTWSRREHFKALSTFDYPHFNMCANVDLTTFFTFVKQRGFSFTVAIVYVLSRASNAVPEFRCRIRAGEVVEHEIVHPRFTHSRPPESSWRHDARFPNQMHCPNLGGPNCCPQTLS